MACWKVVGGADKGGILVRQGQALASPATDERLATDSVVEELQLAGDRLNYQLVKGTGPQTGWVSIRISGKDLLVKTDLPSAPKDVEVAASSGEGVVESVDDPASGNGVSSAAPCAAPESEDSRPGCEAQVTELGNVEFADEEDDAAEAPSAPEPETPPAEVPLPAAEQSAETRVGSQVEIRGLKSKPELNGRRAVVALYDEAAGRFEVKLEGPMADDRVRCKPENLLLVIARQSTKKLEGDANFKEGRLDQAVACYTQALQEDAKGDVELAATIHSNLAATYAKKQDHVKALEEANHAIKLRPDWAKGHSLSMFQITVCCDLLVVLWLLLLLLWLLLLVCCCLQCCSLLLHCHVCPQP
ncbi:unnamed protein product [Polarella glacialis]|uniref:Uncharacterized protein n=1 Tax=Polarella glacialis TaxID=89957 RepID=A0A813DCA8_POLGL|nr:unnamed protein product [Polarella glacialis]